MNGEKYIGQIVQWDEMRRFGFIQSVEILPFGEAKIFVHHSNCIDAPFLGAHCEFEIGNSYKLNRSPQAVRVTVHAEVPKGADPVNAVEASPEIGASSQGGV
jgi:hypothetical protein